MTDITPEQVEKLLAEATPGPYTIAPWDPKTILTADWAAEVKPIEDGGDFTAFHATRDADARLIAAAPDIAAAYLAEHKARVKAERACRTLGRIVDRHAVDICHISGVEMPEDGDADFERAWSLAFEMAARLSRAEAALAEAWVQGRRAERGDWELTFDLTTPDEDRQPTPNPYGNPGEAERQRLTERDEGAA